MEKDILIFWGTLPWVLFLIVVMTQITRNKQSEKKINFLFCFVFTFAAIRYGIGYDYFSYKYLIEGGGQGYELERWELLPRLIAIYGGKFHYQIFFAVSSFLTIWPVYFVCKKLSINPAFSFVVYCLFPMFFLDGLGIMRNAVAFSMVLLMFYCVYKKRLVLSIIFFLIGYGFHVSTIVALLIYPLYYTFHGKSTHITLYVISFALSMAIMPLLEALFSNSFIFSKISSNIEKEMTKTGDIFYYIINFMAIVNFYFWKKLTAYNEDNKIFLSLINIGVVIWNVFLSVDPTTARRLSVFFLFFMILLAPSYLYITRGKAMAFLLKSFFVILFISSLMLNLYAYYGLGRNMSNIPYQVFFLNPSDLLYHIY